jgi:ATP-binding cassette subfamily B protein
VSFERVFEVLDLPMEIQDRPEARVLQAARGRIEFERVSMSYLSEQADPVRLEEVRRFGWGSHRMMHSVSAPVVRRSDSAEPEQTDGQPPGLPERRWALREVSFRIEPGQVAALVGPSGAGKSTITYLLPRLYDPTEGRIKLDGTDLRDIALESLSAQVGMVTQETFLFHDTVRNNLLYARPDASQEALETACRAANIHDFIAGLPEGYDTLVGERGYRLSGGEKQRVAIARVVLKDPRVLILDEATSHLDSQSEALIQQAMEQVMVGRTSLVIAHRLSTIVGADLILVLDEGRLVEHGSHQELLARGGLYRQLYETQFRSERLPA